MKIMTFNILTGGTNEDGSRIEFIKEAISEVSPDFLALQEANGFERDNNRLLKEMSQHIGLPYYALSDGLIEDRGFSSSRIQSEVRRYHLATLSRYPFKSRYVYSQADFAIAPPLCTVIDSFVGELSICNIHLDTWSEDKRLKELEVILKDGAEYENRILLGDLNSVSDDDNYDVETLEVKARFDVTNRLKQRWSRLSEQRCPV